MFTESIVPECCKIFKMRGKDEETVFTGGMSVDLSLTFFFWTDRDWVEKLILGDVWLDQLESLHFGLWG
jgi:hypothetical protein